MKFIYKFLNDIYKFDTSISFFSLGMVKKYNLCIHTIFALYLYSQGDNLLNWKTGNVYFVISINKIKNKFHRQPIKCNLNVMRKNIRSTIWSKISKKKNESFLLITIMCCMLSDSQGSFVVGRFGDRLEMGLFVGRYVLSLLLFGLGLRAPGIVTTQDYINLNNSFHTSHTSQVSSTTLCLFGGTLLSVTIFIVKTSFQVYN